MSTKTNVIITLLNDIEYQTRDELKSKLAAKFNEVADILDSHQVENREVIDIAHVMAGALPEELFAGLKASLEPKGFEVRKERTMRIQDLLDSKGPQ